MKTPMHKRFRTTAILSVALCAASVTAVVVPPVALAQGSPAITTTSPTVTPTGTITIHGTECEANGDATVDLGTGVGTPSEDFWGNIYPIATDANGAFTATYDISSKALAVGTVITIIGQCPFTEGGVNFGPITVTVQAAVTTTVPSTSVPSTTVPHASTTMPRSTTTARATMVPHKVAPVAKAQPKAPTFTG